MAIQDYYGMEGYIERIREGWFTLSFSVSATIAAVAWLYYLASKRKIEKIVVKPGMEEVLSLREGDIVTIERKS